MVKKARHQTCHQTRWLALRGCGSSRP
jgi:hypothetical protein